MMTQCGAAHETVKEVARSEYFRLAECLPGSFVHVFHERMLFCVVCVLDLSSQISSLVDEST